MLNDLFQFSQLRLSELSVCNWGSFDGIHTAHIDPEGTLITGDNGAGKSTLIDGLMALLIPAGKASFNMAASQGDKSDRNLLSYMQGSYGSDYDGQDNKLKSKRDGATCSALRALYRADDGQQITLCAIFWTTQATKQLADVKRLYLVAQRNLSLTEIFSHFNEGQSRALKQLQKQDSQILCCEDNFTAYETHFREVLNLHNKNAPALLQRALGLKQIKNLTDLIRDLVLEASEIRDDARKVVEGFSDLKATHDQLLDAQQQQQCLADLPVLKNKIEQLEKIGVQLSTQRDAVRAFLAEQAVRLWQQQIDGFNQQIIQLEQHYQDAQQLLEQLAQQTTEAYAAYMQAGGSQIENLNIKLQSAKIQEKFTHENLKQYQSIVAKLGLDSTLDYPLFQQYQQQADQRIAVLTEQESQQTELQFNLKIEEKQLQQQYQHTSQDIQIIASRPNSMIAPRYQQLRDRLAEQLNLADDELMFIGELIDVKEQQKEWQGAIERALGGLRNTLLVSQQHFKSVTYWLNQHHVDLHIRVQVVLDDALAKARHPVQFWTDGFMQKLDWRPHTYREWLKHHLSSFDLHCVENAQTLNETAFSMTIQGLVQLEKGRFEKKDQQRIDDQSAWQLGFSNQQRLKLEKEKLQQLQQQLNECNHKLAELKNQIALLRLQQGCWQQLQGIDWQNINIQEWLQQIEQIEQHIQRLQADDGDLARAKSYWQDLEEKKKQQQTQVNQYLQYVTQHKSKLEQAHKQQSSQQQLCQDIAESIQSILQKQIPVLQATDLEQLIQIERKYRDDYEQQFQSKNQTLEHRKRDVERAINIFRTQWVVIAADWGNKYDALDEYLAYFEQLQKEGLPHLQVQFKERLNKHAGQSLLGIRTRLDDEQRDIIKRIDTINQVLSRTEFRQGTFLRLKVKIENYPRVKQFKKQLDILSSLYTTDNQELLYKQLHKIIDELAVASDPATWQRQDSLRLLDPRYQLAFTAEELELASEKMIDVWADSSGKSGGEKEAFAGTIVAASLAYVLTPEGQDYPIYSTIFLDEAFSNTSEVVSKRVLNVFKALHLHINLITPYKNLNLARESARSLIIAERDIQTHESHLSEVTWQQLDAQYQQLQQQQLDELNTQGIELTLMDS
ncbi:MAG: hypothetical protein E6Q89_00700 [Bacteroidia bacterium]|nr:MAG: hypothetical protein E6Q89_00700 [Bacteroidia bacterium]